MRHSDENAVDSLDTDALAQLKAGDVALARRVVVQHAPMMLQAALRVLRSRADAEDAVQEAFASAFQKLYTVEDPSALSAWLRRIAVNAAISAYRKRRRAGEDPIDDWLPKFNTEGWRLYPGKPMSLEGDEKLISEQTAETVRSAIDRLPESHRVVIVLRDLEDMTTREAAEALGIEENALKVRLHRARAALRTLLEPVWRGMREGRS